MTLRGELAQRPRVRVPGRILPVGTQAGAFTTAGGGRHDVPRGGDGADAGMERVPDFSERQGARERIWLASE